MAPSSLGEDETIGTLRTLGREWCVTDARRYTEAERAALEQRARDGEWLTPGQAAAVLRAGRTTVHRWLLTGRTSTGLPFRARTFGQKHRRCNPADVIAVLDSGE